MPMPALPAPVMVRWSNRTSEKSPQVSEPNWVALLTVDRIVESCTRTWWLGKVRPSAKSLLSTIASRSPVDRIFTLLNVTSWQPLNSTAKWPPRRKVTPSTRTLLHSLSDSALSPTPFATELPVTRPSPSIVPVPVIATSCTPSPHMRALWKWLCPKSCHWENEFGSAASIPLAAARIVAPDPSCSVTLLARWIERDRYVPAGKSTVPPPAPAAAAIALLIAGESIADPLPLAPKLRTLTVPAAHAGSPAAVTRPAPSSTAAAAIAHLRIATSHNVTHVDIRRPARPAGQAEDPPHRIVSRLRSWRSVAGRPRPWSSSRAWRRTTPRPTGRPTGRCTRSRYWRR